MSRVAAWLGLWCLLLNAASPPVIAQEREITVHVSYDEFQDVVRPRVERGYVKRLIVFTPIEGRTLRVVYVRTRSAGMEAETAEVTLDASGEGRFPNVRWSRPGEGSTYVRVQTTPTYVMTLTATIEGETCRADVRFDLKPGATEYQMVGAKDPSVKSYLKTLRAEHVTCKVGDFIVS